MSTAAVAVIAISVLLAIFQPWKLWVDETVHEALPGIELTPQQPNNDGSSRSAAATGRPAVTAASQPSATEGSPAAASPVDLWRGTFISHEHHTTGAVRVLALADGSRYLRIEQLDTSNGPDLKVWLTDAQVVAGKQGWHVFDDGLHTSLGTLKGNIGDQNYRLPAGLDVTRYRSVVIWCARFDVSFGAAQLAAV